jgi:hypothetical protein
MKQPRYNGAGERWCIDCRLYIPVANFGKETRRRDGLALYCRACFNRKSKQTRSRHGNYVHHVMNAKRIGSDPLSRDLWREITRSPCAYGGGSRIDGIRIGIDRKDSMQGYVPENVQPCCPLHQRLKAELDDRAFRLHLQLHPEQRQCRNRSGLQKWAQPTICFPATKPQSHLPLFDSEEHSERKSHAD